MCTPSRGLLLPRPLGSEACGPGRRININQWQRRHVVPHTGVVLLLVPADPLRPRRADEHFAADAPWPTAQLSL